MRQAEPVNNVRHKLTAKFPKLLKPVGMIPERYMYDALPPLEEMIAAGAMKMVQWAEAS